jgi:hypothetical protein
MNDCCCGCPSELWPPVEACTEEEEEAPPEKFSFIALRLLIKGESMLKTSESLCQLAQHCSGYDQVQMAGDVRDDGSEQGDTAVVLDQRVGHHLAFLDVHVGAGAIRYIHQILTAFITQCIAHLL